ncbi:undecaprenyldiphospho-muramoylpentapeptide beta-N-acetylglucosaminyltransferase [Ruminiclostridium cellulolyticum]|uniref:UDP-N-acetylglucosamine--N-acetylmuramyl-(pentapeptide) pyrophosphoryl-undecaprenol N-acetylglucosamine transferase n=1 Tax=Ruminiclostridium cellulolyticum (strain ATCC 35319 / DSM 5812 / JCM 6584 / H10) TaxID=394503 RepID=MURG_RUMCH|nr:undecaprenyldiphospho-muramoylpentapeptide beta-N-acetylglucosaminyltransferase [Ruminiclostridium cellulolyticum]B8I6H3.1 RecName: Full=UDP-N-acetylglucosamine--N-acetylmuramyl-(pentapeptide) pyrophosphoryl-undecaprenol N-acetylglucosamine transferase; AltName: Full=Undecaprenyl-PP-MurNAc-pentapeptide-UDPGlcNAc GlcNAc transferase [Ruminiclostridium cellulolyticum H10]ACL74865.1 UDP-N-acetylglucosamine--N-acetylmuramyl-(pentapeptide) pyrophosphoryl-undecaprenol N-acetylglucosamine transferase 
MKVLIAGGGTGGHINPGLAIAKYIKQKEAEADITFVGTKKGLETKLVPREGYPLETITVRGFKRKLSLDTLIAIKELIQSFFQASRLLKRIKPDVVIGTGGYVCGPVLYMAAKKGIPTLIHESNAFPGVTNRLLERYVSYVAISFKDAEKYFKNKKKLVLTGNPVREELLNSGRDKVASNLGIVEGKPLIVAMGGSRGARRINETIADMLNNYFKGEFNLIFATGEAQFDDISSTVKIDEKYRDMVKVVPYIYNVDQVYVASDLMICRAGAITISELQVMGIPSILIPSPYVTANHQEHNARSLERDGGAVVILENELNADLLYKQICSLIFNKDVLKKMSKNTSKNRVTDSAEKIYHLIKEII